MTAETPLSTNETDIKQQSTEMQPTQQNEDVTPTGIPSDTPHESKNRSRRMSLNDLVHSLSPPPSAKRLEDVPEKHLPHLTPEERMRIDGISRAIYDIQREQAAYALESQVNHSTLHVNPFRTFDQLSPEEQEKWKKVKEQGGGGVSLLEDDEQTGQLRFGKVRNEEGEEVFGVWRLKSDGDEAPIRDLNLEGADNNGKGEDGGKNGKNRVIERLNDFANPVPRVIFTSEPTSSGLFNLENNVSDPPQYISRPPSPRAADHEASK